MLGGQSLTTKGLRTQLTSIIEGIIQNEEINKEIKYSRTLEAEYISRTINKRTKKYKTLIILSSSLHFKGKQPKKNVFIIK